MKRDLTGVRLAEDAEHLHVAATPHRCNLARQTALTDARWRYHADHTAMAIDSAVQQALQGGRLPPAPTRFDCARPVARCRSPTPNSR
jgi:hypothetical protein